MILREVVGRRQAVAAAADDDHVVGRLGRRAAPGLLPVAVVVEGIAGEAEDRVAGLHYGGRAFPSWASVAGPGTAVGPIAAAGGGMLAAPLAGFNGLIWWRDSAIISGPRRAAAALIFPRDFPRLADGDSTLAPG